MERGVGHINVYSWFLKQVDIIYVEAWRCVHGYVSQLFPPTGPRIHDTAVAMIKLVLRSWFPKCCLPLKEIRAHLKDGQFQGRDNEMMR